MDRFSQKLYNPSSTLGQFFSRKNNTIFCVTVEMGPDRESGHIIGRANKTASVSRQIEFEGGGSSEKDKSYC